MTHDQTPHDGGTPDPGDRLLDRAIDAARSGPSPSESAASRDRVRARIFGAASSNPCDSFRLELPAFVAGELPEDRATLVADHGRECIPCRKELVALRDAALARPAASVRHAAAAPAGARPLRRFAGPLVGLAAAAALAGIFVFALGHRGGASHATVAQLEGHVLDALTGRRLEPGTRIAEGQAIRTAKDSRATLELPDGSRVELNERAQVSFEEDGEALTLDLERGDIIFDAAPRKQRNLHVRTDDCLVAVKGTVFTVRHGLKGSRVGVLEGSVHVDQAGRTSVLGPGQQVATDPALSPQSLDEQVSWSVDRERWTALLGEIEAAARKIEETREPRQPRFESAILDAMPDTTVLFAAVPNDGEMSALASEISARLASHPQLGEWWNRQMDPASKDDTSLAHMLDTLRRLSDALGEEVVFALLETNGLESAPVPVLAAGLRDEAALRQLVADLAPEDHAPRFADAEELAALPQGMLPEPLIVVHANHVLVGPSADALRSVVAGFDNGAAHDTRFLAGLEGHYDRGADFLVAADLGRTLARRAELAAERSLREGNVAPSRLVEALGVPGIDQFVLTAGENDPGTATLSFREDRSGVASWLAAPGPMGSLDFVTADAALASAALFEDPSRMLEDLGSLLPEGKLDTLLKTMLTETGVDVRDDLVGSLGGEMALALDGPLLPQPSWKLVLEVDDPARFEQALETLAGRAADLAREHGHVIEEPLVRETKTSEGPARAIQLGSMEIHYALTGGYFVAVPNLQLLEASLQARARGASLSTSPRLTELLPGGRNDELSLVAWQDAGRLFGQAAPELAAGFLPPEAAPLLAAAAGPTLGWGRASERSIAFGVNSAEGGLGGGIASLLRRHVVEGLARHALTARDAAGEDAAAASRVE